MNGEVKKLFSFQLNLLGFVAPMENPAKGKFLRRFLQFWYPLVIFEASFGVFTYFHSMVSNVFNIQELTETIYPVTSGGFAWLKLMTFVLKRKMFYDLVNKLKKMINQGNSEEVEMFSKVNEASSKLVKAYVGFSLMTMVNATARNFINYWFYSVKEFHFKASFFFDIRSPVIYEITYFNLLISVTCCTTVYTVMDGFFLSLGRTIVTHLQVLNLNLKNLKSKDFNGSNNKFEKLVNFHNEIIECCNELNRLYIPVLVTQFIFSALTICLVVFQVVWAQDLSQKVASFSYILGNLIGLYFYNVVGTEIIEECNKITNSIYEIEDWFNFPVHVKKKIIFMMTRSQKPFIVHAGFYHVTLASFTYILRSITSYLALLESIHK